jgi:3-oxoacyl-[acyl-carrier protein] reductase
MPGVLENKVAIITGAGRGLGRAFAFKYAEEGAKLLLPDISLEAAEGVANEIRAKGGQAVAIRTDISDEKATLEMAEKAVQQYGSVDILVNNAAIWYGVDSRPWDDWKVEDWDRILRVNLTGTWLCSKAVVPVMKRQSRGKIINIASVVAKSPAAQFFLPYSCSKGAVYTLTMSLARALGPSGINVNAIAPGLTATEASLHMADSDKIFEFGMAERAIPRRQEPADLVGTAVFLASEASDFITGQVIFVDGGTAIP